MNIDKWVNYHAILVVLGGAFFGFCLLLPVLWLASLLPEKIQNHTFTPIIVGVLCGSAGMYLAVNAIVGDGWELCVPFCNK